MHLAVIIIHVLVCVGLIMIVLLQTGKGADLGAAFGGSTQTVFGGQGAGGFLTKLTTVVAVIFMLTSLGLAYLSSHRVEATIMKEPEKPRVEEKAAPTTGTEAGKAAEQKAVPPAASGGEAGSAAGGG